eukprot:gene4839-8424_t
MSQNKRSYDNNERDNNKTKKIKLEKKTFSEEKLDAEYLKKVNEQLEELNEEEKIQKIREERKKKLEQFEKESKISRYSETNTKFKPQGIKGEIQPTEAEKEEEEDDYDMFGDDDNISINLIPKESKGTYLDNFDDEEGYLIFKHGEVFNNNYVSKGFFGKGTYSTVIQAMNISTKEEIAIKIIRNNDIMKRSGLEEIEYIRKLNESDIENKHHIVKMKDNFFHKNHLCIVFEAKMMNLRQILEKFGKLNGKNIGIKIDVVRIYAYQLFLSLILLKRNQILHCDIKPDNILINEKKNEISLTDFGTVLTISECNITKTPFIGSRYYRSPEIALGIDFDYKSDLWSAACTIFELYTGNVLFPSNSNNHMILLHMELKGLISTKLMKRSNFIENYFDHENNFLLDEIDEISEKKIFRKVPIKKKTDLKSLLINSQNLNEDEMKKVDLLSDLLEKCLMIDPVKRIDVEDAIKHQFFEK